jgi:hypothetical protein
MTWLLVLAVPVSFAVIGLFVLNWVDGLLEPREPQTQAPESIGSIRSVLFPYDWEDDAA